MEKDIIANAVWDEFKVGIRKNNNGSYMVNSPLNGVTATEIRNFISKEFSDYELTLVPTDI